MLCHANSSLLFAFSFLLFIPGAVAYLNPPSDNFIYDFTLIEVDGGGHLVFPRAGTEVRVDTIYGDDTGYIHVPPFNTLNMTSTSEYKRINVTWAPFVYESATFVLPNGTVEIRIAKSLSYPNIQRSSQVTFWGIVLGFKAHLMVGYGATVSFATSCPRNLNFVGITVQKTSQLILNSNAENVSDGWTIEVAKNHGPVYREGVVTIEGDGSFVARWMTLKAVSVVVDLRGKLTLDGKGYLAGKILSQFVFRTDSHLVFSSCRRERTYSLIYAASQTVSSYVS